MEMTSLLAVFLANLFDLKDRPCYISRLSPLKPSASSKKTKIIKTSLVCSGLYIGLLKSRIIVIS